MSSRLQRLHAHRKESDLSVRNVAEILGCKEKLVYDLISEKQIEFLELRGSGFRRAAHRLSMKKRTSYHFEPRQILSFIVKQTGGDRATLFAEIEILFPEWLSFARLIAKRADAAPQSHTPLLWDDAAENGCTRTGGKAHARAKADPFAGAPEMFDLASLSRPSPNATTTTTTITTAHP